MNHDSWLMSHPTSSTDSHFLNHLAYPSFTPLHNLHCSKKPWIMSHDSRVILPLIFLAEDGHTIAPIKLWKFHRNWSSHLRVYKPFPTGFLIFWAPDNHAPVGAWLWIMIQDSWIILSLGLIHNSWIIPLSHMYTLISIHSLYETIIHYSSYL